jgi:hypothetical protein
VSIPTDDNPDTGLSDGDAVAQLMASLTPSKKGAAPDPADDPDEDDADDEEATIVDEDDEEDDAPDAEDGEPSEDDEDEEEDDEADEPSELPKAPPVAKDASKEASDDAVVKVTVDGEETEFTVASLKRLAGQEAALTRKSQEADLVGSRAAAVLQGALESVMEDLAPYKDVDWVLEGRRMDPEEFAWHRENYTRLANRYQKLIGSAQTFESTFQDRKSSSLKEKAAETVKVLKKDIPEWSDQLYGDILSYGVSQGLDEGDVSQIADASVIKILHKAMLYDKGKVVATKKVNQAPNKVRKGSGREAIGTDGDKQQRVVQKKIARGHLSDDDAISALTGRWGVKAR